MASRCPMMAPRLAPTANMATPSSPAFMLVTPHRLDRLVRGRTDSDDTAAGDATGNAVGDGDVRPRLHQQARTSDAEAVVAQLIGGGRAGCARCCGAPRKQRRGMIEAAHWAFGAGGGAAFWSAAPRLAPSSLGRPGLRPGGVAGLRVGDRGQSWVLVRPSVRDRSAASRSLAMSCSTASC